MLSAMAATLRWPSFAPSPLATPASSTRFDQLVDAIFQIDQQAISADVGQPLKRVVESIGAKARG